MEAQTPAMLQYKWLLKRQQVLTLLEWSPYRDVIHTFILPQNVLHMLVAFPINNHFRSPGEIVDKLEELAEDFLQSINEFHQ